MDIVGVLADGGYSDQETTANRAPFLLLYSYSMHGVIYQPPVLRRGPVKKSAGKKKGRSEIPVRRNRRFNYEYFLAEAKGG